MIISNLSKSKEVKAMNTIAHNINGSVSTSISIATSEKLKRYTPKGCPFDNYTLWDLLKDFIQAYSWKISRGTAMSVKAFIELLQRDGYAHAVAYGDDIISLIKD